MIYITRRSQLDVLEESGAVLTPSVEAGERYGIRYEELLAFIVAAL